MIASSKVAMRKVKSKFVWRTWFNAVDVAELKDWNEYYDSMVDEALNGSTHQVRLDVGISGNTSHVLDAIDVGQKLKE